MTRLSRFLLIVRINRETPSKTTRDGTDLETRCGWQGMDTLAVAGASRTILSKRQCRRGACDISREFGGRMLPGPHEGGSPTDHVVAVKSAEQQGQLMQHRTRDLLMRQRTQVINVLRAHLAELGIVAAQGREGLKDLLAIIADEKDERSPVDARASLIVLIVQHRASEESKRVRSFPGSALWARAPSPRRSRIRAPSGRGVILIGT